MIGRHPDLAAARAHVEARIVKRRQRERVLKTRGITPRRIVKARKDRADALSVSKVRAYVFERERGICRCCGYMAADSMHEIVFRSQGGKVSKENSIAVCGDGVRGCHGRLQRHEITVRMHSKRRGAEGFLAFKGGLAYPDQERGSEPGSGHITCEWRVEER